MRSVTIIMLLLLAMTTSALTQGACHGKDSIQYQALMSLYNATGGSNWTFPSWMSGYAWGTTSDYCTWLGVSCYPYTACAVGSLQLNGIGMQGRLPTEMSSLTSLVRFVVYQNNLLEGRIDFALDRMEVLDLSGTHIAGSLNFSSSAGCKLWDLGLSGSAIGSLDISGCQSLTYMDIGYSAVTELEISGNYSELISLVASSNNLTDMPVGLCQPQLQLLYLDHNHYTDADMIPCLRRLKNVTRLMIQHNELSKLDFSHWEWDHLGYLDVSYNKLSGNTNNWYFPSLTSLLAAGNSFSGYVPAYISPVITNLYLADNNLSLFQGFESQMLVLDVRGNPITYQADPSLVPNWEILTRDTDGFICPTLGLDGTLLTIMVSKSFYEGIDVCMYAGWD